MKKTPTDPAAVAYAIQNERARVSDRGNLVSDMHNLRRFIDRMRAGCQHQFGSRGVCLCGAYSAARPSRR